MTGKKRAERNRTLTINESETINLNQFILTTNDIKSSFKDNSVIHADLLDCLDFIPNDYFNLIIVDPPYNLDKNLLTVTIDPGVSKGAPGQIKMNTFYPVTFMNLTTTGAETNIKLAKNNQISPDMITVNGEVGSRISYKFPVNSPKRYFFIKLEEAISSAKIEFYDGFRQRKTPADNIYLVDEIKHPITPVLLDIFKNSNNMAAETVFKVAGGKFVNNTGALKNSLKMFDEYCRKNGLKNENIKIVDGSGVSKNNLMTADFMTDFLLLQAKREDFENYMKLFPTAGEGTLQNRMLRNGNIVAFDIMINDPKSSSSAKKTTEEQIIRAIYNKY